MPSAGAHRFSLTVGLMDRASKEAVRAILQNLFTALGQEQVSDLAAKLGVSS